MTFAIRIRAWRKGLLIGYAIRDDERMQFCDTCAIPATRHRSILGAANCTN